MEKLVMYLSEHTSFVVAQNVQISEIIKKKKIKKKIYIYRVPILVHEVLILKKKINLTFVIYTKICICLFRITFDDNNLNIYILRTRCDNGESIETWL
jgi:hypothetical protein